MNVDFPATAICENEIEWPFNFTFGPVIASQYEEPLERYQVLIFKHNIEIFMKPSLSV